ncbi:MAG: hypothetical protein ACRD1R_05780 [Acidobacteriota bacterium]
MNGQRPVFVSMVLFGALWASLRAEGAELIVPIVVNGPSGSAHFQTTLTFISHSTTSDVATGVRDLPDGESRLFCPPLIIGVPPFDLETTRQAPLSAEGAATVLSSSESADLFDGWARVTTELIDAVTASAEVSLIGGLPLPCHDGGEDIPRIDIADRSSEEVLTSVKVPAVKPAHEWHEPVTVTPERESAVALVNPGEEEAEVSILLSGSDGLLVVGYGFHLAPMERTSTFV